MHIILSPQNETLMKAMYMDWKGKDMTRLFNPWCRLNQNSSLCVSIAKY